MKHLVAAAVLVAAFFLPAPAVADNFGDQLKAGTFILHAENDKFGGGTDEFYTNGVQATWVSPVLEKWEDAHVHVLIEDLAKSFPLINDERKHSISLGIGHTIFTPVDTATTLPQPDDRPYAGWLYGSLGMHAKNNTTLDVFEVTLGIVGPSALGEAVQNNFHNMIGVDRAHGWDNQLHDEPGLMLTWQRSWRLFPDEDPARKGGWGFDAVPHLGATLGNVKTYANAGGEVRFGYNLPADFGTSFIGPADGVNAPLENLKDSRAGIHVFAGAEGKAVARDIFLDGNTWEDSPSVAKRTFVGDLYFGASYRPWSNFSVTYTQVLRSKEFYGQSHPHVFGSLTLTFNF